MARGPDEDSDLGLAEQLVFAPRGLELRRFSHAETVAGRTPDFRVIRRDELVAYCEVKSPRDDWLEEQLAAAGPGQIAGGLRADPTFNRIARHIEKAATQFDAVNRAHAVPNILAFANHDDASYYGDLLETVTGYFYAESGERHRTVAHIADGRIAAAKQRIDLYIWLNASKGRIDGYLVDEAVPEHVTRVCELLVLDFSKKIKR